MWHAAMLGQPTRIRRQAISRRFSIPAITVLIVVMLIGIVVPLLGLHPLAGVPCPTGTRSWAPSWGLR